MSKLTRAARLRPCTLRLPGGCASTETTVFAHAPSIDRGVGFKSPDWWGADACAHCHDIADGRKKHRLATRELITERWLKGIYETQRHRFKEGLLTCT